MLMSLLMGEVGLRYGFKISPGIHDYSRSFTRVDSLFEMKGFYADSEGIFRVDPRTVEEIDMRLANSAVLGDSSLFNSYTEVDEIYCLANNMRDLMQGKVKNQFAEKYQLLLHKTDSVTSFDSVFIYYVHHPINDAGFCSIPFKQVKGGKKKILLIGDSFTWGRTVKNITSSFANEFVFK